MADMHCYHDQYAGLNGSHGSTLNGVHEQICLNDGQSVD